jgi:GPH family glycoside/pentoside/hexuronide:cation symporter
MQNPVFKIPATKLTFGEKFGFGLGDTASNFVWGTMTSFLLFYYTDIFGISAAAVGTLFLFARVSDGAVDFFMGAIADRTQSRWGKFRPYLIWMCVPLAVAFVLTFTTPDFSMTGKIIYAWITYNLLMVFYTAINIPYSALSGVMTDDPLDRTALNSYRMALAQVGGLIVNALTLPLIGIFGHSDKAKGYQITILLFSGMAIVLFLITFFTTRERIQPPPAQRTKLREDLRTLFSNRHWIIMFIAGLASLTFVIIRGAALIYYCKYYLGVEAVKINILGLFTMDEISFFLVLGNIGFIVGAVMTRFSVKAIGKKYSYIITEIGLAVTCAAFYWITPQQPALVFVFQLVNAFIAGLNATLYWAMIADTADFSEWKFKVRTTGIIFSATTCSQKVGLGIGGAISGLLLTDYGYVAGATQTAMANQGILLMVSLIPAAGFFFVACVFCLYGLDENFCHLIREDLAKRRMSPIRL